MDAFFEAIVVYLLELLGAGAIDELLVSTDVDLHDMLKLRMF